MSPEPPKISKEKLGILENIKAEIEKSKDILSARIYGSWLHSEKSIDLDICVMIPSDEGIVEPDVYRHLKAEREKLSHNSGQDVDLVPHTLDEISDARSDLYHPRYNPSLVCGQDIKSKVGINSVSDKGDHFTYADLAVHVLLDNRTVCRRQIIRSLNAAEGKIFASKLLHGPGNALTFYSCKQKAPYLVSPSDLQTSLKMFDRVYKVDSGPANIFLSSCKKELSPDKAPVLLKWYEHLVALVLHDEGKYNQAYQEYCLEIGHLNKEQ